MPSRVPRPIALRNRRGPHGRRQGAPDATTAPDPGPVPEAVFDRVTGPYARRSQVAAPGACVRDEDP